MNGIINRIAATLTGSAIAAGILAAAVAAPAQAAPADMNTKSQSCTTSTGIGAAKAGAPSLMTRAGQVAASAPVAATAPSSCFGH